MGNYKIVEANRNAEEYSVFNEQNNFRMTENCKKDLSNKEDHYFGASSKQVNKDLHRNIFLISSEELKIYEENWQDLMEEIIHKEIYMVVLI
jgi:hypothetical protein